ncbi:hypothetical protein [Moorena sp. SIO3I8]|uniref:hypothetical protein n=1 Tax=Moorena sp. SIO3I8 TaxID=2607833 RepID=UPI0013C12849|nr:hypothetical protein [Moorena sp. SIO3I8]NEO04957.1 hypothetical protein [Moorena sp. SIO3I8]
MRIFYRNFPTPYSLLPTPYSRLPTPYSRLPTPYSLLPTPYSLSSEAHTPLTIETEISTSGSTACWGHNNYFSL